MYTEAQQIDLYYDQLLLDYEHSQTPINDTDDSDYYHGLDDEDAF